MIQAQQLTDRVDVIAGDFIIEDTFPKGYDIILLVRTLCVWSEEVCEKIIKMAYEALNDRGYIIICEEFKDLNQDWMLAWEFRYMYWDSFDKAVYKPSGFINLLKKAGFNDIQLSEVNNDGICRVIKAMKGSLTCNLTTCKYKMLTLNSAPEKKKSYLITSWHKQSDQALLNR